MSLPLLKAGLHPDASDAFRKAGIEDWRIGQTIGSAKASAGTHEADGTANGHPYCAATDLRIRDMDDGEKRQLCVRLGKVGFAVFIRIPGKDHWPATEALHAHVIYAGCPMKRMLRDQIHDFLHGKNGLASHAEYHFYQPIKETQDKVRALFLAHNPAND